MMGDARRMSRSLSIPAVKIAWTARIALTPAMVEVGWTVQLERWAVFVACWLVSSSKTPAEVQLLGL